MPLIVTGLKSVDLAPFLSRIPLGESLGNF
jgi:hypothetical protein